MFVFDDAQTRERAPLPGYPDADHEDRAIIERALNLILEFARALIEDPLEIEVRDEGELPVAKDTMIDCFCLILMVETRLDWRRALYDSGLKLAYFWPDVGPERMKLPNGIFERDQPSLAVDQQLRDLAIDRDHVRRFSAYFSQVQPEMNRIAALFDDAVAKLTGVLEL